MDLNVNSTSEKMSFFLYEKYKEELRSLNKDMTHLPPTLFSRKKTNIFTDEIMQDRDTLLKNKNKRAK